MQRSLGRGFHQVHHRIIACCTSINVASNPVRRTWAGDQSFRGRLTICWGNNQQQEGVEAMALFNLKLRSHHRLFALVAVAVAADKLVSWVD